MYKIIPFYKGKDQFLIWVETKKNTDNNIKFA
jgi:hypothetical protein